MERTVLCRRRTARISVALWLALTVVLSGHPGLATVAQASPVLAPRAEPSTPTLVVYDGVGNEGTSSIQGFFAGQAWYAWGRPIEIVVDLIPASPTVVTVAWTTAPGGGAVGDNRNGFINHLDYCRRTSDYANSSGVLQFDPGVTRATILVQPCSDADMETNESFLINLSNPTGGAQIGRGTATATIVNDDGDVIASIDDAQLAEGTAATGPFIQTIHINMPAEFRSGAVAHYATRDASATGGSSCDQPDVDYIATSGQVNLNSSGGNVDVQICPDSRYETDESFTVTLSEPSPGVQITHPISTVILRNDDPLPAACQIRPTVQRLTSVIGPGRMQVTVRSTTSPGTPSNPLNALVFDRLANASVEVNGQPPSTQPFTATLTGQPTEATFVVNRVGPGPVTVQLRIQDSCGSWPTFVGAGTAGF
jgi:hypothetical protein